jgi:hypothetical protein
MFLRMIFSENRCPLFRIMRQANATPRTDVPRGTHHLIGQGCVFCCTTAIRKKPAACFARRVKFSRQKYLSFRKTEVMI